MWKAIRDLFASKKFLVTLAGAVVAALGKLGLAVPPELVADVVALVAAYVVGQGLADWGKSRALLTPPKEP